MLTRQSSSGCLLSCCVPTGILRVLIFQAVSVHAYESERRVLKCVVYVVINKHYFESFMWIAYDRRFDRPEVSAGR